VSISFTLRPQTARPERHRTSVRERRTKYQPYLIGGSQERGRRGGTENVANIVAFGRAAEMAMTNLEGETTRIRALRDKLESTILSKIPKASRNGAKEPRLPNTSNIAFEGVEAEGILMLMDQVGICASSGSACTTGSLDPSHVLMAWVAASLAPAAASASASAGTIANLKWIIFSSICLESSANSEGTPGLKKKGSERVTQVESSV